ncbi:MAG: type II secretion system protein N [Pseudomonadota bacterium]
MDTLVARVPDIVKIAIIAGIAWTLATAGIYFVWGPQSAAEPRAASAPNRAQSAPRNSEWNAVAQANLFGPLSALPTNATPAVADVPVEKVRKTRLPLTLQGVFVADEINDSAAIVSQKGKPGIRYAVGDKLPGSAELVEVHGDHIILRRAGVREALHFPKTKPLLTSVESDDQPTARPVARSARRVTTTATRPQASRNTPTARRVPPTPVRRQAQPELSPQEAMARYRDGLDKDPEGTLKTLGVTAVNDGVAKGYKLGAMANSSYLRNTGLQAGDVLLSVNGQPVGDVRVDRMRLDNVLAQGSARLEIQRGERRFFVTAALK